MVWAEMPKASRRPQLQAAWKQWLTECGYVPVGNQRQQQQQQQRKQGERGGEGESSAAAAAALSVVSETAVRGLCEDGFVVIDDVLPPQILAAARIAAERLRADGKMKNVGQEGRDDDIAVLDAADGGRVVVVCRRRRRRPRTLVFHLISSVRPTDRPCDLGWLNRGTYTRSARSHIGFFFVRE